MTTPLVDLVIEDPGWQTTLPDLPAIAEQAARLALDAARLTGVYEISILACSDTRIAQLNADFRGKPAPTNVLSWPAHDLVPAHPGAVPPAPPAPIFDGPSPLGDVAIALQTCVEEANSSEVPLKNHVIHLILHGSLHLLGYDHDTEADAARMEGIESRALAGFGIPDPYA